MLENGASSNGLKPLLGTEYATLDKKGRLLLSKKKRDRLGVDFTVALGDLGCLVVYPQQAWLTIYENIMRYDSINQAKHQYQRLVLALADDELNFDSEGRFVVPAKMRDLARLKDNVVIMGLGDRLEIWDTDEYAQYLANDKEYGAERRNKIQDAHKAMVGS